MALQAELVRLGYTDAVPDGVFGQATQAATRAFWRHVGELEPKDGLPISQIIWLPTADVIPLTCPAVVGATVPGPDLFTTGGGLTSLTVSPTEEGDADARVAFVGDSVTPIPETGLITDREFLDAFARTPAFAAYLKDPSSELKVSTRLDETQVVTAVPASALYSIDGTSACVISGGDSQAVTIVASQFGNTLVRSDPPLREVDLAPDADSAACR